MRAYVQTAYIDHLSKKYPCQKEIAVHREMRQMMEKARKRKQSQGKKIRVDSTVTLHLDQEIPEVPSKDSKTQNFEEDLTFGMNLQYVLHEANKVQLLLGAIKL